MAETREGRTWLTAPVAGIGIASMLSDLGHEVPTALLPSFLTSTLGAPAAALGLIEGVADGGAGIAKLVGGGLADDPARRRAVAVGGYAATALLSGAVGLATTTWQVGVLRTGAWVARGVRGPSRNALLADAVPATVYGRAFGFERAMDNLGAIAGPLLAIALVATVGVRSAIVLSTIPGLMAAVAILYAVQRIREHPRQHVPFRIHVRPVMRGELGRILLGVGAFEFGNLAATLMILRATELLQPSRGVDAATSLALWLYVSYNVAATLSSVPAGRLADRIGPVRSMAVGVALFLGAYLGLALTDGSVAVLAAAFVGAGIAIGTVETSEHTAVAGHAPEELRGSAFGLLAAGQSLGNLIASGVAGLLWTAAGPTAAFLVATGWMAVSLGLLVGPMLRDRTVHHLR